MDGLQGIILIEITQSENTVYCEENQERLNKGMRKN